jgi:FkbM family methyltransferase
VLQNSLQLREHALWVLVNLLLDHLRIDQRCNELLLIRGSVKKNLDQGGVNLFKEAIGSKTGFASLVDNSESRLCQIKTGSSQGITIIPLQEAINRIGGQVDLLKIDCEGAEWDIFRNPEPFKSIKAVRMEYHLTEGRIIEDIKEVINKLGFTLEHLEENSGFGIVWFSRN